MVWDMSGLAHAGDCSPGGDGKVGKGCLIGMNWVWKGYLMQMEVSAGVDGIFGEVYEEGTTGESSSTGPLCLDVLDVSCVRESLVLHGKGVRATEGTISTLSQTHIKTLRSRLFNRGLV